MNASVVTGIVLIVSLLVIVGGVLAYPVLKNKRQGYPLEAEIEAALLPFIYQGILGAYRTSEQAMDQMGKRLEGCDKKLIADMVYTLMPSKIGQWDISLVKTLVPPERFEQLVQDAFDLGMTLYNQYSEKYAEAFKEWQSENAGG